MSERSKGPCGFPLSIREYVQAAWSIATGQFMTVGDSPLADLKEQTTNMSTNIDLMSALVLTMIVPIMYDAGLGPQNNSYMVTDPFWVGSLYFALACSASWTFAISTVFAVLNHGTERNWELSGGQPLRHDRVNGTSHDQRSVHSLVGHARWRCRPLGEHRLL